MGRPAFPFIGQGEAGVYNRREEEKERELRRPEVRRPPVRVGPGDRVDRGGSGVVLGSCWLL